MKAIKPIPAAAINYYTPLLQRYARRLIKDEAAATQLAKKVLTDQYYIDGLMPSKNLRQVLKFDLLNRCHYFRQAQIFDRPPVKVPLRKYVKAHAISDKDENRPIN